MTTTTDIREIDAADVYHYAEGTIQVRAWPTDMPESGTRVSFNGAVWTVTRTRVLTPGGRACYHAVRAASVPVVIVTRDPDYSNEYAVFGGDVETIDIDFGAVDLNDAEEFADWRESLMQDVFRLREINGEAANYIEATVAETAANFGHEEV